MMKFSNFYIYGLSSLASPALVPLRTLLAGFALCWNRAQKCLPLAPLSRLPDEVCSVDNFALQCRLTGA